jgi:23S rRNA pseudouridine1911/1915/1917 synthase
MAKKFSKPELSRMINGDIPFDSVKNDADIDLTRLDVEVLNQNPRYSRATIQKFIKAGYVTVNGEVITKPNFLIEDGADIVLTVPAAEQAEKPPVIYEDDNVIVFNKPAGMLSIKKGDFSTEPAIEDFGYIVHRLDRDTSGVIIVAKNFQTKGFLQKQFQERKTHKTYYAVVCGTPAQEHAIINIPLARNLKKPTTFMPDKNGREAITEYRTIDAGNKYSLIELKPRTGRTHQLRIHMNFIHCPILGDPVYNPKGPKANRMYLHAAVLEITIPGEDGGQRLTFTADLPKEFEDAVK